MLTIDFSSLNPLGIGESFEQMSKETYYEKFNSLNPLGIGESFELNGIANARWLKGLNPLGIGESFELTGVTTHVRHSVLIP